MKPIAAEEKQSKSNAARKFDPSYRSSRIGGTWDGALDDEQERSDRIESNRSVHSSPLMKQHFWWYYPVLPVEIRCLVVDILDRIVRPLSNQDHHGKPPPTSRRDRMTRYSSIVSLFRWSVLESCPKLVLELLLEENFSDLKQLEILSRNPSVQFANERLCHSSWSMLLKAMWKSTVTVLVYTMASKIILSTSIQSSANHWWLDLFVNAFESLSLLLLHYEDIDRVSKKGGRSIDSLIFTDTNMITDLHDSIPIFRWLRCIRDFFHRLLEWWWL